MHLTTQSELRVDRPIEEVFDYVGNHENFARYTAPHGPIPAITRSVMLNGAQPGVGAHRLLTMSDGSELEEEVLELTRPSAHRYRWVSLPKPPFSWLISAAEGGWRFEREAQGTRIVWTYRFELTSPLAYLPAALIIRVFRGWQEKALGLIRAQLSE